MGNGKEFTKVSSSVSTTEYTAFDILGRVTAAKQTTEGGDAAGYSTGYTYNLSGALVEETYPSGRKVKNVLDNDGELSLVQSARCGEVNGVTATCSDPQGYFSYAKSFTYNASGAVTSMQLGNGRWESTTFNSRLQPTQIALGTVQNATDKLKLDYTYGTTANNGNVLSQKITVPRSGQSDMVFDQTYTYDSLNRLKMAEEKTGTTTNWKQTFVFDRYGNRNFDRANTTQPASFANPNISDPSVDAANNRFTSGQGYTYDAAGNVITDAEGRTFTYDGENKQIEVRNSGSSTIGQYYFDGDGRRVKKYVPSTGETTVFVYDASGKLVAEYSTNISATPRVQYQTLDNLGTPRINTDQLGAVVSRTDYMPYGEEIIGLGGRTAADHYTADDVRQGFTGYINDEETGLDFAQARIYASGIGRFTQFDPVMVSQSKRFDPQGINPYAYCQNNPLKFTDSSGAILDPSKWDKRSREAFNDYLKKLEKDPKKYAAELATIEQLKKSDVNYVVSVGGNTQFNAGQEGGLSPDPDNNTITINLSNDRSEKFSLFSRFGHEFEHARQFDSGEFGYVWDENGKLLGRLGGDISEEVSAWKVQLKLSNAPDRLVRFANDDVPGSVLDKFDMAESDMAKAKVLSGLSESYERSYEAAKGKGGHNSVYGQKFTLSGVPPGTLINRSTKTTNGRTYFGRNAK